MKEKRTRRAIFGRRFVAAITLQFVLLQSLAAVGFSVSHSADAGAVFALDPACARDAGHPYAPHQAHDHGHCCILCDTVARLAAPPPIVSTLSGALPAPSAHHYPDIESLSIGGRERQIGWGTSWSSQAPPSLT
ncbi:hypothetical protein [Methylocystis sp. ATCC 49242]|uniref:hypothetical protein n=1 Tax=Methylocystis sp. ATCC 49242 TaxID=622637 RepID=UPI0001F87872|nr:hypothetical protein [Methylocystis sp. ATCC 49242]